MLARLLALALLLAGPLAPGLALAQAETGFSRSLTRVVLREAFEAIIERHLEVAAPEEMALWSLRGLGAVDTGLTAEVQGGLLRLYLGGALLAEAPLPSSALAPQGRPDRPRANRPSSSGKPSPAFTPRPGRIRRSCAAPGWSG
ncbi:hypothetical protein [Teichococcus aestuarii]|uniref:hypothetical protein n=1 Tax=Teichococcus aestuarii TaxID=568898 RepID=UPI00361F6BCA